MKTLNRLLLIVLSATLLISVFGIYSGMTSSSVGHDTFYTMKWPWLREVRLVSLFGVLVWCLLFVKNEPLFARIGLISAILALAVMLMPIRGY